MYIAYGWPKLLEAIENADDECIVHISVKEDYLIVVSSTHIQIWTSSQHRMKIGEYIRDSNSIEQDGINIRAIWNGTSESLAVLTSKDVLHFYDINSNDKAIQFSSQEMNNNVYLINIKFRSSTNVPLFGDNICINGFVADEDNILLGLSKGILHLVSWRGQLRGTTDILNKQSSQIKTQSNHNFNSEISNGLSSPHPSHTPHPLQFPLSTPSSSFTSNHSSPSEFGIYTMDYSPSLHVLLVVLMDGRILVCNTPERGLRPIEEIIPKKWMQNVMDAECISIANSQQILAVGTRKGTVELFNLSENLSFMRSISLFDWGYSVEDTGPVNCISWTTDNLVFAVGWKLRGLAVWSISGCRLMCSIRQGSMSNVILPSTPQANLSFPARTSEPLVNGVSALAWGRCSYNLIASEEGYSSRLIQFSFARACMNKGVAGSVHAWQLMQGEDRVLLIQSDEEDELKIQHLVIPQSYISSNWPVRHVSSNDDGSFLAISGKRGVILYNLKSKKWRVFGDVTQERAIECVGLLWMGKIVVMCCRRIATNSYELNFYPRYHLDESSLLYRLPLNRKPISFDSWLNYILICTPPFELKVFYLNVSGELSPTFKLPLVQMHILRELSIVNIRKPLISIRLVPNTKESETVNHHFLRNESLNYLSSLNTADYIKNQPTKCMLLRTDGELSLLNLDNGSEKQLVGGVEQFWLSEGRPKGETLLIEQVPWWAYGHRGMQVWYPSSQADVSTPSTELHQLDPELDFDREVYPLGISPTAGIIVGISQRLSLSSSFEMPSFEPTPQAQPILPCLLRHLLQRNKLDEAVRLARLSALRPHFSHSLEWLLFTIFDSETSNSGARKRAQTDMQPSMLKKACTFLQNFSEYLDVVVSVARKTDSKHWAELFAAAGNASDLFEECFQNKMYHTATCYILVIEKLEGPTIGQQSALRLLQATLKVSMYELAGELVRFLVRSGREFSSSKKEEDKNGENLLKSFFSFGFTSTAPKMRADVLHKTVNHILGDHAAKLFSSMQLKELISFVKGSQFEITNFLLSQKGKCARLEDFPTALTKIEAELDMHTLQGRLDAEFLLGHVKSVKFYEWTIILATLLSKTEVLMELFTADIKLWLAYAKTLKSLPNSSRFEELLKDLDSQVKLSSSINAYSTTASSLNGLSTKPELTPSHQS